MKNVKYEQKDKILPSNEISANYTLKYREEEEQNVRNKKRNIIIKIYSTTIEQTSNNKIYIYVYDYDLIKYCCVVSRKYALCIQVKIKNGNIFISFHLVNFVLFFSFHYLVLASISNNSRKNEQTE